MYNKIFVGKYLAPDNGANAGGTTETTPTAKTYTEAEFNALKAELEAQKGETSRYKEATSKANSEAAAYKKQLNEAKTANLSELEKEKLAHTELVEKYEQLLIKQNHSIAENEFLAVGLSKEQVKDIVPLLATSDEEKTKAVCAAVAGLIQSAVETAKVETEKATKMKVVKDTTVAGNAGGGSGITKEQILAMDDPVERRAAMAKHADLFGII